MFGLSAGAAIAIGAVAAGATAVAVTAHQSANAAKNAANAQMTGQENAIQTQQAEFNTVNNEYAPGRTLGYGADTLLAKLFGMSNPMTGTGFTGDPNLTPSASTPGGGGGPAGGGGPGWSSGWSPRGGRLMAGPTATAGQGMPPTGGTASTAAQPANSASGTPDYSAFYNSPNYQFALSQGEQAINRNASASGGAYSTSTLTNLDKFAAGTASQQYQSYVGNLLSMAGLGATATQGTANAGLQTANNVSAAQVGIGNANASGILGANGANNTMWNAIINPMGASGSGGGGGGSGGGLASMLQGFMSMGVG